MQVVWKWKQRLTVMLQKVGIRLCMQQGAHRNAGMWHARTASVKLKVQWELILLFSFTHAFVHPHTYILLILPRPPVPLLFSSTVAHSSVHGPLPSLGQPMGIQCSQCDQALDLWRWFLEKKKRTQFITLILDSLTVQIYNKMEFSI